MNPVMTDQMRQALEAEHGQPELSQFFIDVTTPDGKLTGLLHDSTVKGEHSAAVFT